jgi:hypothetical protein
MKTRTVSSGVKLRYVPLPMPVICAWCKVKERIGGRWQHLRSDPTSPLVSHGICPGCSAKMRAKLEHSS